MTIPYVTFMKHAQKVTKSASASRSVLKGVHHASDGSLYVTDSHRLYVAKNSQSRNDNAIIEPKTGATIDGNYPDCSRLIPDKTNAKATTTLPVDEALKAFEALLKTSQVVGKGSEIVSTQEGEHGTLAFSVDHPRMNAVYNSGCIIDGTFEEVTFNIMFMVDALKLFKDVGVTEVEIRFHGATRPFTLSAGDGELLALLLPIRIIKRKGDD